MEASEALKKLEDHKSGPIPTDLVSVILNFIPQIIDLISRKSLKKQVESQGKLIQIILQKNLDQDKRIEDLEKI